MADTRDQNRIVSRRDVFGLSSAALGDGCRHDGG